MGHSAVTACVALCSMAAADMVRLSYYINAGSTLDDSWRCVATCAVRALVKSGCHGCAIMQGNAAQSNVDVAPELRFAEIETCCARYACGACA